MWENILQCTWLSFYGFNSSNIWHILTLNLIKTDKKEKPVTLLYIFFSIIMKCRKRFVKVVLPTKKKLVLRCVEVSWFQNFKPKHLQNLAGLLQETLSFFCKHARKKGQRNANQSTIWEWIWVNWNFLLIT